MMTLAEAGAMARGIIITVLLNAAVLGGFSHRRHAGA